MKWTSIGSWIPLRKRARPQVGERPVPRDTRLIRDKSAALQTPLLASLTISLDDMYEMPQTR